MPTYTYRCQKCGNEFERFQSMSDEPVKRCPKCKGKVQRTFHPVGIVLKGSGFHKTDYRTPRSSGGSGSKTETKSEDKGTSKTETETKPAETKSADKGSSSEGDKS